MISILKNLRPSRFHLLPRHYSKSSICFHQSQYDHISSSLSDKPIGRKLRNGPKLSHFLTTNRLEPYIMKWEANSVEPYLCSEDLHGKNAKVFIKTYGCQMNVNDTSIASTILTNSGYCVTDSIEQADIVFLMTCAIRENAEGKVWHKLRELERAKRSGYLKKFGLLGCMAERLKGRVLQEIPSIDIIAGPDSYRHLPKLLAINWLTGQSAINVLLSLDETYSDVIPQNSRGNSAFVSITRGCNNMCSFCIVPFTRGQERSRPLISILKEVQHAVNSGIKEIILLGQNVNSYRDFYPESGNSTEEIKLADGFKTIYKLKSGGIGFDVLLDQVAQVDPNVRIRFTSPHPKDFNDNVLSVIAKHDNIAKGLHLPAQSGSNQVLERMRRGYTKEAYLALVERIRQIIPNCGISSDFICGFCSETEQDHRHTLDLVERVGYYVAYIFAYSMREKTYAYHHLKDDVPEQVKISRLTELNQLYRSISFDMNRKLIGSCQLILVEGDSKKSGDFLYGRNDANQKVIIPKRMKTMDDSSATEEHSSRRDFEFGDFVKVKITDCTSITLIGEPIAKTSITAFNAAT